MNPSGPNQSNRYIWVPLLLAAALKFLLLIINRIPFNADEAIVALMARHINQGARPIFFYGQTYMGSLDAFLVGAGFRVFGEQVAVIRVIQSLLYLGTVALITILTKRITNSREVAFSAGVIAAVPPVNVSLYTTVSLGGYGEALLLGSSLLLVTLVLENHIKTGKKQRRLYLLAGFWGVLAGIGFWVNGMILLYMLPAAVYLIWKLTSANRLFEKEVLLLAAAAVGGILIGSLPWWISAVNSGPTALITELAGSAIKQPGSFPPLLRPFQRIYYLLLLGSTVIIGMRPPWEIRWLMLPMIPIMIGYWTLVCYRSGTYLKSERNRTGLGMLAGVGVLVILGFVLTPFGGDPSGRYFVPLILPMAVFGALLLQDFGNRGQIFKRLTLTAIVIFHLGGTIQSVMKWPPGLTTQFDQVAQVDHRYQNQLIDFLERKNISAGYTNYWVSYPLAFLSEEEIIFVPHLPYHPDFRYTERDDRYPPYREMVQNAERIAYITTHHKALNNYLRDKFSEHGISWDEQVIGDYHIFFNLSGIVRPRDIDLGLTSDH